MNLRHEPVASNFVYPEIKLEHYRFGALPLKEINPSGDWRPFLPPEEDQNIRGIESSACYVEAQQHTIATIEEFLFGEQNNNYSARFNAFLSDGTPTGGDPLKGADSMRNDGLVTQSAMPFDTAINSWEDFHSWKGVSESAVRAEGKAYKTKKQINNEIVFERDLPLATKQSVLRTALKASPVPISVTAWYVNNGIYYKPAGLRDNHLVEAVYIDSEGYVYIRDTYAPYLKKLDKNYNFDFAMRWAVQLKEQADLSFLQKLVEILKGLLGLQKAVNAMKPAANPLPAPVIAPPLNVTPEPMETPKSPAISLYDAAYACIGQDLSKRAPNDRGCAESVSRIIGHVIPGFPVLLSTIDLNAVLEKHPRFQKTTGFEVGTVAVGPTHGDRIGHCWIMGKKDAMSNNSATGKFEANYTNQGVIKAANARGLTLHFYKLIS